MLNSVIDHIKTEFDAHMQSQGIPGVEPAKAFDIGKDTVIETLKKEVLNGNVNDIVSMFTQTQPVDASNSIMSKLIQNFSAGLQNKASLSAADAGTLSVNTMPWVANKIKESFNSSGHSRDINGLADFLGIDKTLLNIASSPIGKLFGKFM